MLLNFLKTSLVILLFTIALHGYGTRIAFAVDFDFVDYTTYDDATEISQPFHDQIFYGKLNGFPHNFNITLEEDSEIYLEVHEFDSLHETPDKNVLLVGINKRGPVTKITRLDATSATWEDTKDAVSRDEYVRGPSYAGNLTAGNYLIEVSSPENIGRYALVVRQTEQTSSFDPLREYVRVYKLKMFLDKSVFSVFVSPIYYVPLLLFVVGTAYFYVVRRRKADAIYD